MTEPTQNQQLNQDCFTGTRQTNINNACEWNCCSTWLVLNQLRPRKLTQTSSPAGNKCTLTLLYILTTRHFTNLCFLLYPISIVCCIYTGTGETFFTGTDTLYWGRIRRSKPLQMTYFSTTNWQLAGLLAQSFVFSFFNTFLLNKMLCNGEQNVRGLNGVKIETSCGRCCNYCKIHEQVSSPVTAVHQLALRGVTTSLSFQPHLFYMDQWMSLCGVTSALVR